MSKFKSFASQGSFRDYQLQAPDETAKVKEETARKIRGMERAEQFRQGNAALYLQAQKLAQGIEEQNRETNFKLETENRRAFKQQLDQEYELQAQAAKQRAAVQQKTFQDLSAFSKTAFQLANQVNQQITENQTKANVVNTIIAGTTIQDNLSIKGLADNLTRAEFEQQDIIARLVKEGKDADALWGLYGKRNTRGYIENTASVQNSARGLEGFLNETLLNLPDGLTAQQKKLAVETAYREYLANSFKVGDNQQVSAKFIANVANPILNAAYTRVSGELDREIKKERLETLRQDKLVALNVTWDAGGGVAAIHKEFTTNPSNEKRALIAEWVVARLEANTLSPEDARGILDTEYIGPNGTPITWRKQFPAGKEVALIDEAIRNNRRTKIGENNLREQEAKDALDADLTDLYNQFAQDGSLTKQEYGQMEAVANEAGIPQYESPILKEAYQQQDSVRTSAALSQVLTAEYNAGILTTERVNSIKGLTGKDKQNFLNLAAQQEKQRETPVYKTDVAAIKAAVSQDPRLSAAPVTGDKNYSVLLMQDRYTQMYKATLARTGDHNEARATTLAAIQTLLANPQAITQDGKYAEIVAQEAQFAVKGKQTLEGYQQFLNSLSDADIRNNPQKLADSLGAAVVYNAYDEMKAGKPTSQLIKNGAALMGMTPLDFVNYLAQGANNPEMPPITVDAQLEKIRANIKPLTRRLYNTYRTNERVERANYTNNNSLSTAPTRGTFNVVQYVSNDPRFKDRTFGPIVYDEHGHGGKNMHVHYEFATQEEALAAKALYESKGFRISSFMRPEDTDSAHSKGFAIDVAPPLSLPYNEQAELNWIRSVNAVIGYDPTQVNSNE